MNGVPAIRPQFPDYGNVLARGAAIKGQEARNVLTQMQMEGYPEERNWLREQRGYVREDRAIAEKQRIITQEATAFATALRAKNAKTAKQIYNAMKPEGSKDIVDFKMDEKTTSVTYGDGTKVEGPISYVTEATEQIAKDPTWVTDPEKTRHFAAWCAARKITFTAGQKEKPTKPTLIGERQALLGPKGKIVAKGAKWGKPKEFKPDKEKPEVKESTAIDKIVNIKKAIAKFDETGLVDAWIMKNEPELAATLNKAASPEDKEVALDAMQKQATYYMQFLSEANKKIFGTDNDPMGIR